MTHNTNLEQARSALMAVVADSELLARQIASAIRNSKLTKAQHEEVLAKLLDLAHTTNDDARRLYGALQQQLNLPEPTPSYTLRSTDGSGEKRPLPARDVPVKVPRHARYPRLSTELILQLADEWFATHGSYPLRSSGRVSDDGPDTWSAIDQCLRHGLRGLTGGSGLPDLLAANRVVKRDRRRKKISAEQILQWADNWFQRTGKWPMTSSGDVPEAPGETWGKINTALVRGVHGAGPGGSLSKYLNEKRGVPIYHQLPNLTVEQILSWADTHYEQTGRWPKSTSGDVVGAPGETWQRIDWALNSGTRTLEKHVSLARLLSDHRGVRHKNDLPELTLAEINSWVLKHYQQHQRLPRVKDGEIPGSDGQSWQIIDEFFRHGRRGLASSGYSGLKDFLEARFPRPDFGQYAYRRPRLSLSQILAWADAHYARTGKWPCSTSGTIAESEGDTWLAVSHALTRGVRGLTAGKSLDQLLGERRNHTPKLRPDLSAEVVLRAADAFYNGNGDWPTKFTKGSVPGIPHETWSSIDQALNLGTRGLPASGSLVRFLHNERGAPHRHYLPDFTLPQIEQWARSYKIRHGHWPSHFYGGPVDEAPTEQWRNIYSAFKEGRRGLSGCGYKSLTEFCRSLDEN